MDPLCWATKGSQALARPQGSGLGVPGEGAGLCWRARKRFLQKGPSAGLGRMRRVLCLWQPRCCSRPRVLHPAPSRKTSGGVLRLEVLRGEKFRVPPATGNQSWALPRAHWGAGLHPSPAIGLRRLLAKPLSAARQDRDHDSDHFPVMETEAQRANTLILNLRAPGFTSLCPHLDVDGRLRPSYLGWRGTAALCRLRREPRPRRCRRPR